MNLYQEQVLDHYHHPHNYGKPENHSHFFTLENISCGDTVTVYLQAEKGVVESMHFEAEGCAISVASASMLSEAIVGKSIQSIEEMTIADIVEILGIDLTPSRQKCAVLALEATKKALKS